jgi:RNA polymerase sigma factor (sigma-70 family)
LDDRAQDLVERASQGERGAVEELLVRYLPELQDYVARHASPLVRGQESVDDLALSVCREVLESLRGGRFRYQGEGPFRQWLYRAAVMKLLTRHRHWRAERRDPGRAPVGAAEERSAGPVRVEGRDERTPSLDAIWSEELARFQAAFERLPERHQRVILLHQVEALGHAEIAERLGISEANSRMLLSRALGRLGRLAADRG